MSVAYFQQKLASAELTTEFSLPEKVTVRDSSSYNKEMD